MILWIEENFLLKNSIDNRNSDLGLSFKSKNEFLNLHMNNGRVIIETKVGIQCNFYDFVEKFLEYKICI